MNHGAYMLDTNILIYMLRGFKAINAKRAIRQQAEKIRTRIDRELQQGARIYVSMVTICELEYSASKTADPARQRSALNMILAPFERAEGDALNLPRHYGEIRCALEQAGQPIGAMDLMIAAHARALNVTLVTNNVREFDRVKGLSVVNWTN
jgi:tRNA(fMet)-specific endonuclease VapC